MIRSKRITVATLAVLSNIENLLTKYVYYRSNQPKIQTVLDFQTAYTNFMFITCELLDTYIINK